MSHAAIEPGVQWVKDQQCYYKRPHELTADEERCVLVLCSLGAPYNLPMDWQRVEWRDHYIVVRLEGEELATYDFDGMTRLVVAAHRHAVRVAVRGIRSSRSADLQLLIHVREHDAEHQALRHPSIAALMAAVGEQTP